MKKVLAVFCILLVLNVQSGCAYKNNTNITPGQTTASKTSAAETKPAPMPVPEVLNIQDYFPLKENLKYIYSGKGNEYASYAVYTDYISMSRVQQRLNNGGTETVSVIELKDGKLTRLLSREESYYRENLLEAKGGDEEILLKEPVVTGNSWKLKDTRNRTITNTSAEVSTPAGNFKAIEVTTSGPDNKTMDYYAKNIGLVKTVFIAENSEVSSALEKIEENAYLKQKINFYYPKAKDQKIYFVNKEVTFKTNDITKKTLEQIYKNIAAEQAGKEYGTDIKINSLYLNKDSMVYLDMNSAFITRINKSALPAAYEKLVLQSIANTAGIYYNVKNVIITIENKPYKSNNLTYKSGEPIKVNLEGAVAEV